jgi:hypothetical protein
VDNFGLPGSGSTGLIESGTYLNPVPQVVSKLLTSCLPEKVGAPVAFHFNNKLKVICYFYLVLLRRCMARVARCPLCNKHPIIFRGKRENL